MRRNSNYFGDLSQFFLRAKKEENFALPALDPEIKKQLRDKLALKISEIKNPQTQAQTLMQNRTQEKNIKEPAAGFWTMWRRQLISVPASLFALLMIVYAADNLNFSLQTKEDFSPRTNQTSDLQTTLLDTNPPETAKTETAEDSFLIAQSDPEKIDTSKPDLLVLDINNIGAEGEIRTLNRTQPSDYTTESSVAQTQASTADTQKTTDNSSSASSSASQKNNTFTLQAETSSQSTGINADSSEASESTSAETTPAAATGTTPSSAQPETVSSPSSAQQETSSSQSSFQPENSGEENIAEENLVLVYSNDSTAPVTTSTTSATTQTQPFTLDTSITTTTKELSVVAESPINEATTTTINQLVQTNPVSIINSGYITTQTLSLNETLKEADVFVKTVKSRLYSTNYYKDSTVLYEPVFDTLILSQITADKSPTAVNVYYISGTQVLVEIVEGTTKKLYLYEKKSDSWTVVKYEKL